MHINELELEAAGFALMSFKELVQGKHVLIQMDDQVALTYINKTGGTQTKDFSDLAIQIWEWCLERSITLTAEYLPGKENLVADYESQHYANATTGCSSPASLRLFHTGGDPSVSTHLQ